MSLIMDAKEIKLERYTYLKAKDIARKFDMSEGWVYRHKVELGGFTFGRTWFFTEEGIYHAIQRRKEKELEMERSRNISGEETSNKDLLHGERSKKMGSIKTGRIREKRKRAAAKHGLDRFMHQVS